MKRLKHILVVAALLVAAVPCCHAHEDLHDHGDRASPQLCAPNSCACHACEEAPCAEDSAMPMELAGSAGFVAAIPLSIPLFTITVFKPIVRPEHSGHPPYVLAYIKTVQLLI